MARCSCRQRKNVVDAGQPPSEWRTPSVPAGEDEPPFDVEVHTDVIVRPRR